MLMEVGQCRESYRQGRGLQGGFVQVNFLRMGFMWRIELEKHGEGNRQLQLFTVNTEMANSATMISVTI